MSGQKSISLQINKTYDSQKVILVSGGAGFIGSHLVEKLIELGHYVVVIDNLITGRSSNLQKIINNPSFMFINRDITEEIQIDQLDEVYHLASIASPPLYMKYSIETIRTNVVGTLNLLELCHNKKAKFLLASTSEVYGDPEVHPQTEDYKGNVNFTGPRACYDESKRLAETITYEYHQKHNVEVRIARIFNTYGPRMRTDDGRVVSNFICQALSNNPLTVYGDGSQTRSFMFISDLIDGLILLMNSDLCQPINLGNPYETKIINFAKHIQSVVKSESEIIFCENMCDDPKRRKPNIEKATTSLNWQPKVPFDSGILKTTEYFKSIHK